MASTQSNNISELNSTSNKMQNAPEAPSAPETHSTSTENNTQPSHQIVLAPETLTSVGPIPITNTLLTSWIVMATIIVISILATRKMRIIPKGLQNLLEFVVEQVYNLTKELSQEKTKYFFPIIMTFFLFILVSNWFGLLPGFSTIGFYETHGAEKVFVPFFRSINSDLNSTLGLALISVAATHYYAVKFLGVGGYLKKWFSLNPIMLFVGLLELVSEVTKTISLSFRLFGNVFAGEVVLTTISGLFAYIAPLPFYLLEVLVGVVQAAVFMMLTLVFMVVLSEKHEAH